MTILVTGATGLLGSRLVPRLLAAGTDCRVLVRSGSEIPVGAIAVEGDLLDPESLAGAVEGVSAIVHLAAVLRTPDTDQIWKVNLEGTRNLVSAVKHTEPMARLIMASTGLVYDAQASRPGREDDASNPQAPYPASKLAAERELRESDLIWSILRFGFVYGDRDGHLEAVPRLASMFKWHPASRLSMIHHLDVATAVRMALTGAWDGRIVNVSDEAPMTIHEIFELVGLAPETSMEPLANPWFGHMNGALARQLGFQPEVRTLYQAVRETLL